MAQVYTVLLVAAAINNLALLYLLFKRPERSSVVISFTLFLLAITVWGVPQIFINWLGLYQDLYVQVDRISALGYVTLPSIFFVFSLAFSRKLSILKNTLVSLYVFIPAIIFLYLSWTTFLIDNHSEQAIIINEWGYNSQPGAYFAYFLFWLESLMVASIGILISFYRSTANYIQRKQVILLIIAVLIPLILGTITDGVLPLFSIHIFPSAVPLTTVMAIVIGYAILKYELFDLEADTILASIGEGVLTVDINGKIQNTNAVAAKMIGKKSDEIFFKKVSQVISADTKQLRERLLKAIEKGKKFTSSEFVIKNRQKGIPISITVTPIEINRKIVGTTILMKDIREDKKREKSKDEFISIASHELKTPITSIKLYADILANKISQNTPEHTLVYKLQDQVDRMLSLTNDLLDLSRIRTGNMQLNLEQFNIVDLLTEIIDTMQKAEPKRKITLHANLTQDVYADKNRISQVIYNLITNAIKYSPPTSRITVTCTMEDSKAVVHIRDYGQGIPSEQQNKVFDRFYRVNGTTTDQTSLGIGLYVSATIIKKHKGKIWVTSRPKKGSIFSFTLPLADSQQKN